jgi:hypothetical protein
MTAGSGGLWRNPASVERRPDGSSTAMATGESHAGNSLLPTPTSAGSTATTTARSSRLILISPPTRSLPPRAPCSSCTRTVTVTARSPAKSWTPSSSNATAKDRGLSRSPTSRRLSTCPRGVRLRQVHGAGLRGRS